MCSCNMRAFLRGNIQHCEERRKRYAGSKPDILSHWVEEPNTFNEAPHGEELE